MNWDQKSRLLPVTDGRDIAGLCGQSADRVLLVLIDARVLREPHDVECLLDRGGQAAERELAVDLEHCAKRIDVGIREMYVKKLIGDNTASPDPEKAVETIKSLAEKNHDIRAIIGPSGKALREAIQAFREANPRPEKTEGASLAPAIAH